MATKTRVPPLRLYTAFCGAVLIASRAATAGDFVARDLPIGRSFAQRAFTVGIGGPVGSGKTALLSQLCKHFRDSRNIAVVTNDIFTREDAQFLLRHQVKLPSDDMWETRTHFHACSYCLDIIHLMLALCG